MLELKPPEMLFPEVDLPAIELPAEDGVPLESNWHRIQMNLLIDSTHYHWRDRRDYFAGGNMFIYFSSEQVRNRDYRGPDFFVVKGVAGEHDRDSWIVWEEKGRYPNLVIELASPSTIDIDLGSKKELYEQTFHTPEYYVFNPDGSQLFGWRLTASRYVELEPNNQGWLWSEEMGLWLGAWQGEVQRVAATWLRFYTNDGLPVSTLAEAEAWRVEAEAKARREAEARVKVLEARLQELEAKLGQSGKDQT
jgi:Uma2 family endonuclease